MGTEGSTTPASPSLGNSLTRWSCRAVSCSLEKELDADSGASVRSLLKSCWSLRAERAAELSADPASQRVDAQVATANLLITITGGFFGQASEDEWLTAPARAC
eukprot:5868558-Prymnesium_polylepis.1